MARWTNEYPFQVKYLGSWEPKGRKARVSGPLTQEEALNYGSRLLNEGYRKVEILKNGEKWL